MDYAPYTYESVSTAITRRRPLHTPSTSSVQDDRTSSPSLTSNNVSDNHLEASNEQLRPQQSSSKLKRTLSLMDIIFYGVGCSVGAGIYSLVGIGANLAGPSIAISFALCGIACCFTSLGYAEFASRVPLAGSAYTFTYVSFGELAGWLVGWNLTLGYGVSASVVARSWAEYLVGFIQGWMNNQQNEIEDTLTFSNFLHWSIHAPIPFWNDTSDYECCPLAILIILLCTMVLVTGAKESSRFNTIMTILNLSVLGFVILAGVGSNSVSADNLLPVLPHGWQGVGRAAGLVFFSYLGFDMVSCLSEEVENPERNMPIGIIGSLLASMSIYCTVSIVVVGMAPTSLLGEEIPIVNALLANACCTHEQQLTDEDTHRCLSYTCQPLFHSALLVGSRIVSCGAVFGLTTACFACLMGQPRIFFSMAQDGLLFKIYAKVNPKTGVPTMGTILTGIFTALVACFIDLESLANAISLGTLQVFTFVNAGVIILRMTPPVIATLTENSDDNESGEKDYGERLTTITTVKLPASGHYYYHHHDERSPLLPDEGGAILIKHSSRELHTELRHLSINNMPTNIAGTSTRQSSITEIDDDDTIQNLLKQNGPWPHCLTLCFIVCAILMSLILSQDEKNDNNGIDAASKILMIILTFGVIISTIVLIRLPQSLPPETFQCPFVPIIPLLGILCNSYMMGSMPMETWIAITVWLFCGVCFYFAYGMHHSELRTKN